MYIEDVAEFAHILLTTTEMTFDCGWQRIQILFFCQLAAMTASRPGLPSLSGYSAHPDPRSRRRTPSIIYFLEAGLHEEIPWEEGCVGVLILVVPWEPVG